MFDSLSESLRGAFSKFTGRGKLTESNIKEGLREVRKALLEADVNYKVARDFIQSVTEKAVGEEVLKSVRPGDQIVKIVQDELTELMGPVDDDLSFLPNEPTVFMMAGLQGSGKTTTCGKLARFLQQKKKRRPLLVAADVQRPAAIEQLKVVGSQVGVPVYAEEGGRPPKICQRAVDHARKHGMNTVILDTAGRLHIDDELMNELAEIQKTAGPHHVFLVCDGMTGQDAVNSAAEFDRRLPLDGVILTKLDGDTRGGAALSVKAVTGKPIRFIGVGEKVDDFEAFHPDRLASRILGMGDIVSLVEKAQERVDQDEAQKTAENLLKATFTFEDFLSMMQQVRKMGKLRDLVKLIPGLGGRVPEDALSEFDESNLKRVEAIITSMTPHERTHPDVLDGGRRRRIARGSGTSVQQVNELLREFRQMRTMMKRMTSGGGMKGAMARGLLGKSKMPAGLPAGMPGPVDGSGAGARVGGRSRPVVAENEAFRKSMRDLDKKKKEERKRRKRDRKRSRKGR